ncbi:hypothetical protein PsorP6_014997 [Peronosclerospora sorghi]|uniref:Uncharacterized protein n=1 Tax=Peronosclerospora sorghi TaxID=230839 RepID=A0ACC0VTN2_9STRA|nr:hypothetical protein PsorP6_014997 [Peronosclerospora sorghi]
MFKDLDVFITSLDQGRDAILRRVQVEVSENLVHLSISSIHEAQMIVKQHSIRPCVHVTARHDRRLGLDRWNESSHDGEVRGLGGNSRDQLLLFQLSLRALRTLEVGNFFPTGLVRHVRLGPSTSVRRFDLMLQSREVARQFDL